MLRRLLCATCLLLPSPGLAQEREWFFDTSETEAFLVFGVPESDDAGISFWCQLRSGEIRIFLPEAPKGLQPGSTATVTLRAGGETMSFTATVEAGEDAAATSTEARVDTGHPLFGILQTEDRFTLAVVGEETVFPLAGADFPALLRVCGKP